MREDTISGTGAMRRGYQRQNKLVMGVPFLPTDQRDSQLCLTPGKAVGCHCTEKGQCGKQRPKGASLDCLDVT